MHAFLKVDLFKLRHIYSCVKCLEIHENSGQMFSSSAHLHRKAMGKQCSKKFSLWIAKHYTGYMMQYLIWIHTDSISSTVCVSTNRWAFRCTCASIKKNQVLLLSMLLGPWCQTETTMCKPCFLSCQHVYISCVQGILKDRINICKQTSK